MNNGVRLSDVLTDRVGVNMLRMLYENEHVRKTSHTMPFFRLNSLLGKQLTLHHVLKFESAGLLTAEKVEDIFIISLNAKGKEFVEQLDALKSILEQKERVKSKPFKIEYDLMEGEEHILVVLYKLEQEQGSPVSANMVAQELYPRSNKKALVARKLNKLSKLKLVEPSKRGKGIFYNVSPSGRRIIKEQSMESII